MRGCDVLSIVVGACKRCECAKKKIAANRLQRAVFFSEWKFQIFERKFGVIKTALKAVSYRTGFLNQKTPKSVIGQNLAGKKSDLSYSVSGRLGLPRKKKGDGVSSSPNLYKSTSAHNAIHNSLDTPPPTLKPPRITPPSIALPRMAWG